MKLIYIAPVGLFDNWARTTQIMKMCEAFSIGGVEVELIVPLRANEAQGADPYGYNGVVKNFSIVQLPILDLFYGNPSKIFYWLRWFSFILNVKKYLRGKKYDVLYTREPYYSLFFKKIYLEQHKIPTIPTFFLKRFSGFIVLTSFIKNQLIERGVDSEDILVAHDGVRLDDFSSLLSKEVAKDKFRFTNTDKIFGYVGTLKTFNMEKGVSDAIASLEFLPNDYKLFVVGGDPLDVDFYKTLVSKKGLDRRVVFTGRVAQKSIPEYISACDVVVAPFPKNPHYEFYMSPLKIFEYMASHRPMVVTNLPSLREVLKDGETALFVEPGNPEQLAHAIQKLFSDTALSEKLANNAYNEMLQHYTWDKRAESIINFIKR